MKRPDQVLRTALRVGRKVIVSFPNFGYYSVRLQIFGGQVPVTPSLPFEWYYTPNLHFLEHLELHRVLPEERYPYFSARPSWDVGGEALPNRKSGDGGLHDLHLFMMNGWMKRGGRGFHGLTGSSVASRAVRRQ